MPNCLTLKKSNCKNCYKCIRHCPVKAIRFSGNQAHIIKEECILCGQCFVVCPQDAKQIVDETEMYAGYYGYDLETYVSAATGYTMEQFEESCRANAIQTIQSGLLQAAILEEEGLELSDEEYKVRAEAYMPMFGYETLEEFEAAYTKEKITNQCLADMVMEVMVKEAVVEE